MAPRLKPAFLWLAALWFYWWTRLHNLGALPVFLDEAAHIWWARLAWDWQLFHAASDGRLLNVLWAAVFWPFSGSVWVARAATVLLTTVGFAALLALSRRFFPPPTAAVAAVTYAWVPFALFFERMQLPDAYATACAILLLWSSAELARSPHRRSNTALTAIALAAGLLSKLTNLVFVPVPALAALVLGRRDRWRAHARATLQVYLLAAVLLLPVLVALRIIAHSDLGLDLIARKTAGSPAEMWAQAKVTSPMAWSFFRTLFTPWLWWPGLATIAIALWQRARASLYVCATALLGLLPLIAKSNPGFLEARFMLPYVALLILLMAAGAATLWKRVVRLGAIIRIAVVVLGILALHPSGQFMWKVFSEPAALELPWRDDWEYIRGWPSGFGFRQIAAQYNARGRPQRLLTFDLGGQQRLAAYLPTGSVVTPVWAPPEEFAAGLAPTVGGAPALLVLDHPKDDADLAALALHLRPLQTYPRPGGESWLTVYELSAPASEND